MPIHSAIYVPSRNKIFGTMGPHLLQFNAVTGAKEAITPPIRPGYNADSWVCYHAASDTLYFSLWHVMEDAWYFDYSPLKRTIYPIDPDTLEIGTGLFLDDIFEYEWPSGPRQVIDAGNRYLMFFAANGGWNQPISICAVDPSNTPDFINQGDEYGYSTWLWMEQMSLGSDGWVYVANPDMGEMQRYNPANLVGNYLDYDYCTIDAYVWDAVRHFSADFASVNSTAYAVAANNILLRVDTWDSEGGSAYTKIDMTPARAGLKPLRLRYRSSDSKLYLPDQGQDGILVWNPATDDPGDAVWKGGFDGPIDVVFTGSKAFAVQSGIQPLKEIV